MSQILPLKKISSLPVTGFLVAGCSTSFARRWSCSGRFAAEVVYRISSNSMVLTNFFLAFCCAFSLSNFSQSSLVCLISRSWDSWLISPVKTSGPGAAWPYPTVEKCSTAPVIMKISPNFVTSAHSYSIWPFSPKLLITTSSPGSSLVKNVIMAKSLRDTSVSPSRLSEKPPLKNSSGSTVVFTGVTVKVVSSSTQYSDISIITVVSPLASSSLPPGEGWLLSAFQSGGKSGVFREPAMPCCACASRCASAAAKASSSLRSNSSSSLSPVSCSGAVPLRVSRASYSPHGYS
ncbi:MAG: hypothetical protein BWY11_02188 [Firmicutes bacterium ADurb.Bin182]|nr:MAG: hypothetical protein BWY11_02188 [Firmicutes bacterium ADurb.Bin182]